MGRWLAGWLVSAVVVGTGCRADTPTHPSAHPATHPSAVGHSANTATEAEPGTTAPDRELPIHVAITVDDLPAHGPMPPGVTRLDLHLALLEAFKRHHVPDVVGFVNGERIDETPELAASLDAWTAAGHPLGNHTYAHPRLENIGLEAYLKGIEENERVLATWGEHASLRRFRYPYLFEGDNAETTRQIRSSLETRGYRVAPVTIDFYDWAFNPPYVRCLAQGDDTALAALRKTFLQHAWQMLGWSDAAARQLYGRPIPHILLMHVGSFDAVMIEEFLAMMERQGVEWISLEDALADPIYAELPIRDGVNRGTLLEQQIDATGAAHPPWITHPEALLGALCRAPASTSDARASATAEPRPTP